MILHFEGLDLAGKSTVCRMAAKYLPGEWTIRSNALTPDNRIHKLADELRKSNRLSSAALGLLYNCSLRADLEWYQAGEGNIIQDSTVLLRSLAFHTVEGNKEIVALFEELIPRHPVFDATFICSASRETRLERLQLRRKENLGPEDFLVRDDWERFSRMEECLIAFAERYFRTIVLDTNGNLHDAAVIERIIGEIKTHAGMRGDA